MACGAAASAAFVFEGTVQSIDALPATAGTRAVRRVRFAEVRHVRGAATDVAFTGPPESSCSYEFKAGERYFVVAGKDDRGRAFVSLCGLTRRASDAALLLQYLQTFDHGPAGGRVFGRVSGYTRSNAYGPIAGATITVEGPVTRSTTTRADGTYTIQGLPYGGYNLAATAPRSLPHLARTGDNFELRPDKPCRENVLHAQTNGRIQGRVVDPDRRPVENARVELVLFQDGPQAGAPPMPLRQQRTGRDGRYQFNRLPPGVYSAGVNIGQGPSVANPFEPAFARRRRGDAAFVLPLGGAVSLPPIVATMVPRIQQPIRVLRADGRPMIRARLRAAAAGTDISFDSDLRRPFPLIVDGEGQASLDAWQGTRYVLMVGSSEKPLVRREILAGNDLVTLVVP